jgi:hypothetical protein
MCAFQFPLACGGGCFAAAAFQQLRRQRPAPVQGAILIQPARARLFGAHFIARTSLQGGPSRTLC